MLETTYELIKNGADKIVIGETFPLIIFGNFENDVVNAVLVEVHEKKIIVIAKGKKFNLRLSELSQQGFYINEKISG